MCSSDLFHRGMENVFRAGMRGICCSRTPVDVHVGAPVDFSKTIYQWKRAQSITRKCMRCISSSLARRSDRTSHHPITLIVPFTCTICRLIQRVLCSCSVFRSKMLPCIGERGATSHGQIGEGIRIIQQEVTKITFTHVHKQTNMSLPLPYSRMRDNGMSCVLRCHFILVNENNKLVH